MNFEMPRHHTYFIVQAGKVLMTEPAQLPDPYRDSWLFQAQDKLVACVFTFVCPPSCSGL